MKIIIENIDDNPISLMRKIGYVFQRKEGEESSLVRVLASGGYPRFHIYCRMENGKMVLNLHLDQKKETYGHAGRHHGEYNNDGALATEAERIRNSIM
jgi:hypothetical protein